MARRLRSPLLALIAAVRVEAAAPEAVRPASVPYNATTVENPCAIRGDTAAHKAFVQWKQQHRRKYASSEEEASACTAFLHNHAAIEAHQQRWPRPSYEIGHNAFSDLSWDEFQARYLQPTSPGAGWHNQAATPLRSDILAAENDMSKTSPFLPQSVDWRQAGIVSIVRDQGECGACWSFVAIDAIEALWAIRTGNVETLSTAQLIACDEYDRGCAGGNPANAFQWAQKHPLCSDSEWPYDSDVRTHGACTRACKPSLMVSEPGGLLPRGDESSLLVAIARQPIAVSLAAGAAFQLYRSGVFDDAEGCSSSLNHAALAVGYGGTTQPFYLLKNSWGVTWGEGGYIRLARGSNLCQVASASSYPVNVSRLEHPVPPSPPTPPTPPPTPPHSPHVPTADESLLADVALGLCLLSSLACACALLSACRQRARPPLLVLAVCAATGAAAALRSALLLSASVGLNRNRWLGPCVRQAAVAGALDNAGALWCAFLAAQRYACGYRSGAGGVDCSAGHVLLLAFGGMVSCAPLLLLLPPESPLSPALHGTIHACGLLPFPALGALSTCTQHGELAGCDLLLSLFVLPPVISVATTTISLLVHDCFRPECVAPAQLVGSAGERGLMRPFLLCLATAWSLALVTAVLEPLRWPWVADADASFVLRLSSTAALSALGFLLSSLIGCCGGPVVRRQRQRSATQRGVAQALLDADMLVAPEERAAAPATAHAGQSDTRRGAAVAASSSAEPVY